jgi:hypothetical protein
MMVVNNMIRFCMMARSEAGIGHRDRAKFGDCTAAATALKRIVEGFTNHTVVIKGGKFVCDYDPSDSDEPLSFDHTWLEIDGIIVDPTVDQFFSDLDVDMDLVTDGMYIGHPDHDADTLKARYECPLTSTR